MLKLNSVAPKKMGLKIPKAKVAGLAKKGDRASILADTLGKLRKAKKV